jgi:hypothetical protein
MAECTTSAKCTDAEYQAAREAGLLVVTVADEIAIHKFAEAMRAEGYAAAIEFIATGDSGGAA